MIHTLTIDSPSVSELLVQPRNPLIRLADWCAFDSVASNRGSNFSDRAADLRFHIGNHLKHI